MLDEVWDRKLAMHLRHTIDGGDEVGLEMQVVRKCHTTVFSGVCARRGRGSEPRRTSTPEGSIENAGHEGTVKSQPCYGAKQGSGAMEDERM